MEVWSGYGTTSAWPGQDNVAVTIKQAVHAPTQPVLYRPGQKKATQAPATAMALPTQSPVSGRVPSTAQPHKYDKMMKKPPYTA